MKTVFVEADLFLRHILSHNVGGLLDELFQHLLLLHDLRQLVGHVLLPTLLKVSWQDGSVVFAFIQGLNLLNKDVLDHHWRLSCSHLQSTLSQIELRP